MTSQFAPDIDQKCLVTFKISATWQYAARTLPSHHINTLIQTVEKYVLMSIISWQIFDQFQEVTTVFKLNYFLDIWLGLFLFLQNEKSHEIEQWTKAIQELKWNEQSGFQLLGSCFDKPQPSETEKKDHLHGDDGESLLHFVHIKSIEWC